MCGATSSGAVQASAALLPRLAAAATQERSKPLLEFIAGRSDLLKDEQRGVL